MRHFSVSELARRFGIPPRAISDLFYSRALDDAACPIVAHRRLIPLDYVQTVAQVLRARGLIAETNEAASLPQSEEAVSA
jgi:hypothetical protein